MWDVRRGLAAISGLVLALGLGIADAAQAATPPESARFARALRAFENNQFDLSRNLLRKLVRSRPRNALYWFNLGNANVKLQDWSHAKRAYRRVIDLKSPLAAPAALYLAKIAEEENRDDIASSWLKWALRKRLPSNVAETLRNEQLDLQAKIMKTALEKYQAGQYQDASYRFNQVIALGGDAETSSQARLMNGLVLLKSDRSEQALRQFERLQSEAGNTPGIRDFARYFSTTERQVLSDDPEYWLFVDLALGHNSNVFEDSDDTLKEARTTVPWTLGGGWRPLKSGLYSIRIGNNIGGEESVGLPSARFLREIFWTQIRYQTSEWMVQFSPQIEFDWLGTEPYLFRPSFTAQAQRAWPHDRVGLNFLIAKNNSRSPNFYYVDGSSLSARLFWLRSGRVWSAGPFFAVDRENSPSLSIATGTLPLAYTGYAPGFSGLLNLQPWELSGSMAYAIRNYTDLAEPGAQARSDGHLSVYARIARRLRRDFSVYFQLDGTVNQSSLDAASVDNLNYSRFIVLTGLSWDLL